MNRARLSRPMQTHEQAALISAARQKSSSFGRTRDYFALTKPEITFLVAISAIAGFVLGSGSSINSLTLLVSTIGISLTSAGACALNQYFERESDRRMKRTAGRPLPAGRISPKSALVFGFLLVAAGLSLLCPLTNPTTAVLAFFSVLLYLFVYTPLKKRSWTNTLVGAIPGAMPILGGYAAASNSLDAVAVVLFGVLFFWQLPHFYAIAWMYKEDYGRGDYIMLPSVSSRSWPTVAMATLGAVATFSLSLLLAETASLSLSYLVAACLLGAWFCVHTFTFSIGPNPKTARRLLKTSVLYIPLFVFVVILDSLL